MLILETSRLILRTWQASDFESMLEINQDPQVMEFFPSLQDFEMTQNLIHKINAHYERHGFTFYAVETKDSKDFIGMIGLAVVGFEAHFTPAIEIGWRLSSSHWGKGLATEGAQAVLEYAFEVLGLSEIVSFTALYNEKSRRVMEKIGMSYDVSDDFNPPKLDGASPLRHHVLYRLSRSMDLSKKATGFNSR